MTVCRRYARHDMEAEDWLQETFVKIFTNLKKFKHKGSFEGWVRTIAVHTCLKNCKKSKSVEPDAISALGEEELLKLIQDLPEGYRTAFNMSLDGFSHKEIAQKLGIRESTSRSQLVKARSLLKQKIEALKKNRYERKSV